MVRYLVISLAIPHGLHVYGQPAPEGMLPLTITVTGPTGLITLPIITPETELLRLQSVGVDLHIWHGRAEFIIPFYATGELASEVRPLDQAASTLLFTCNSKPAMMMSAGYQRLPASPLPHPWTSWTSQS